MTYFRNELSQFSKRMSHDEEEMQTFGQFIVRYMPLQYLNHLAEHLMECLDARGLDKLEKLMEEKAGAEMAGLRERRYALLNDIQDQKKKLFKDFEELREAVGKKKFEVAEEEEGAEDLRTRGLVDRLDLLEGTVRDLESALQRQQDEARARLDEISRTTQLGKGRRSPFGAGSAGKGSAGKSTPMGKAKKEKDKDKKKDKKASKAREASLEILDKAEEREAS